VGTVCSPASYVSSALAIPPGAGALANGLFGGAQGGQFSSKHARFRKFDAAAEAAFKQRWTPLAALGCTYESAGPPLNLFAVDVPPAVDFRTAESLLRAGKADKTWGFERSNPPSRPPSRPPRIDALGGKTSKGPIAPRIGPGIPGRASEISIECSLQGPTDELDVGAGRN